MKPRPFSANLYNPTYKSMNNLIKQLKANKYHACKFKACCKEWAEGGRYALATPL